MSLLMEALKKAEEAKRQASASNSPNTATPELTHRPTMPAPPLAKSSPASASPLPDLSQHIDAVDADLAAVSAEAPTKRRVAPPSPRPSGSVPRETDERSAVRNVFSAKKAPRSRTGLWFSLGLCGIAALGIVGYFWWQLQSVSGGSIVRPAQTPELPQSRPPVPGIPVAAPVASEQAPPLTQALPAPPLPTAKSHSEPPRAIERATQIAKLQSIAKQALPDNQLRLSRNQSRPDQTLEQAYDSLQAGHLEEAQRDYERVLGGDAKNTDALLGLATIAARQGKPERAQTFYQLALESDPNDATAQAGVINTKSQANPGTSESRLKTALASQPESSALHFALGNLYARQNRWSEAQQAYFKAYASEPDNADFIFNLAVSLDHLHQNKLAAQYYQRALNAAGTRMTSFDTNQVKNRLLELQP